MKLNTPALSTNRVRRYWRWINSMWRCWSTT